jgi:hypothetical protein
MIINIEFRKMQGIFRLAERLFVSKKRIYRAALSYV